MPSSSSSCNKSGPPPAPHWQTEEDLAARFLNTFAVLDATALEADTHSRVLMVCVVAGSGMLLWMLWLEANPRGIRPHLKALEATKLVVFLQKAQHFHVALRLNSHSKQRCVNGRV